MEVWGIKIVAFLVLPLLMVNEAASAAMATGSGALALASLVAANSPLLSPSDKKAIAGLFDGNPKAASKKISVQAESVVCRASNVDLTSHSCDLSFGKKIVSLKRRMAHELFATLEEAGVPSEGAAGTIFEGLSHLICTIDPQQLLGGGGADCKFDPSAS